MTTPDVLSHSEPNGLTSDPAMSDVGSTLRRLRVRARLTQEMLAASAGVGQKTVSQIETGRRESPSPIVIGKLDAALEAGGALLETLQRARDDRVGWTAVLEQLETIARRLATLEEGMVALTRRLDVGGPPADQLRQWIVSLAAYGEAMSEADRASLTAFARHLADKHSDDEPV